MQKSKKIKSIPTRFKNGNYPGAISAGALIKLLGAFPAETEIHLTYVDSEGRTIQSTIAGVCANGKTIQLMEAEFLWSLSESESEPEPGPGTPLKSKTWERYLRGEKIV